MKRLQHVLIVILATATLSGCAQNTPKLDTKNDTLSWALGESYARAYKNSGLELDKEMVLKAFEHTLNGEVQPLDEKSYEMAYQFLSYTVMTQQKKAHQENDMKAEKEESALFDKLEKENSNIKKAPSGFYYEIVKAGTGAKAVLNKRVSFDYKGYNMRTGEPFDQTYGKRDPIVTVLNDHIFQGLCEGMLLMEAGSIYRFYFPSKLAFGANGSVHIPPYTPVIYEVELHEVLND